MTRKTLLKKILRRDILHVLWGKLVVRPLRATPIGRVWETREIEQQDATYVGLERYYYGEHPARVRLDEDWKSRSSQLLRPTIRQGRPKRNNKDIRILMIHRVGALGVWYESEVARSFDAVSFDLLRHHAAFLRGETDLVSASLGVNPDARSSVEMKLTEYAEWRKKLQSDIIAAVQRLHSSQPLDLCFVYGCYTEFDPKTLQAIRDMGIPVALMWLDEKHAYGERPLGIPNGQKPMIGACDVHLTNTFSATRWYMAEGAAAYYFPEAADPEIFKPTGQKKDIPVSFVGQRYGLRTKFVEWLREQRIPVQCFGPGWENGPVKDNAEIYARSLINLGIGYTGKSSRVTCLKGRDFEVPMAGAAYLTTYDYELAWHFHIGKEVLCFLNEIDCVQQLRYYLQNPQEVERIGAAARSRSLAEHTWTYRFEGLLRWLGILA